MGKNHSVGGINWSSLRKMAIFVFGEVKMHTIVEDKHYFIYIDKTVYYEKKELVNEFENYFLVNIKPFDS